MRNRINQQLKQHSKKIKFAISGCIVAVVGISVLYVLTELLDIWYLLSSTIAFFIAIIVNFILQKTWAFQDKDTKIRSQMGLFFMNALLNLGLNTLFMYYLVSVFGVHHILSQMFVMVALAVMNYTIYSVCIFRTPPHN